MHVCLLACLHALTLVCVYWVVRATIWALALFPIHSIATQRPLQSNARSATRPHPMLLPLLSSLTTVAAAPEHLVFLLQLFLTNKANDRMFVIVRECSSGGPGASSLALRLLSLHSPPASCLGQVS